MAHTIGGTAAVVIYAGIVFIERLLGIPDLMRLCTAVVDSSACSPVSYVLALWADGMGVALATRLVLLRRGPEARRWRLLGVIAILVIGALGLGERAELRGAGRKR